MPCPCGSLQPLANCCAVYHAGATAPTAEHLMRSRYTAYVLGNIDYLVQTTLAIQQPHLDCDAIAAWSRDSQWLGLNVLTHTPYADQYHASVEFIAKWQNRAGETYTHQERSSFVRCSGRWYVIDPNVHIKIGRNDDCVCGQRMKFKKCCARFF